MSLFERIEKTAKKYASPMGYEKKKPAKEMTMREMLAKTRTQKKEPNLKPQNLNEQTKRHSYLGVDETSTNNDNIGVTKLSGSEEKKHEDAMLNFFDDDNVIIKFQPIEIFKSGKVTEDNTEVPTLGVFWGGNVDGQLKFAYMITPDEATSGVKIERASTFDPNNADNQAIEKKIIDYYDTFFDYWSNEF